MSVHAGTFFFDGRPSRGALGAIETGLRPLAPDGVTLYAGAGLAMGHGAFHVWSGEGAMRQPLRSAAGLVAIWDGRLDNRDDLRLRLGDAPHAAASDAAIAVAAFERWGLDGLRALVGEWSLAIWDGASRTLHLARDYMGVRPLYYCADAGAVRWSSSLGELAHRADRVHALSDAFVAGFMTLRLSSDVTPYEGIRAVPTATCVSFAADGAETRRRFWQLEPGTVRYRDARQYEEHVRALWQEAVGARLRTDGTVWAELSGGLDSSSVVCMADWLMKAGRVEAHGIQPISHVTLESPEGDERRFIAEVEAHIGVRSEILGVEAHYHLSDSADRWISPFTLRGVGLACVRHVVNRGGRLVLSGRVGDAVMGAQPDNSLAVLDDIAQRHVLQAVLKMRAWSRACRVPIAELAWGLGRAYQRPGTIALTERNGLPVDGGLLTARLRRVPPPDNPDVFVMLRSIRPSKRVMARLVLGYALSARLDLPHQSARVTYTYPFTHRPLIEYLLAIPGEELSAPAETRSLMRRSFREFVPARILSRRSKGYYPPANARLIRSVATAMLPVEALEVVQRGWIDPGRLESAVQTLTDGGGRTSTVVQRIWRLEQWLAARARRRGADIPERKEVKSHGIQTA